MSIRSLVRYHATGRNALAVAAGVATAVVAGRAGLDAHHAFYAGLGLTVAIQAVLTGRRRRRAGLPWWRPMTPLERRPHVLYRVWTWDGQLAYIGIAVDWEQRRNQHRRDESWWRNEVDDLHPLLRPFPNRPSCKAAEDRAIADEDPLFNRQGNDRPDRIRWQTERRRDRRRWAA